MTSLALALLIAFRCLPAPVCAAEPSGRPAPVGNRYLFIVDTSSAMKRLAEPTRGFVFDLVFTGLEGQMQNGDTFGLWVFAEATLTDFPMQVWTPHTSFDPAAAAAEFLTTQRHDKPPDVAQVLRKAASVIRSVKDVTLLIVSDGSRPIEGTPFDREINQVFKEASRGARRPASPYVTVLAAREGVIEAWRVIAPGQPLALPLLPAREQKVADASQPALPTASLPPKSSPPPPPTTPASKTNAVAATPTAVEKPKVVKEIKTVTKPPEAPIAPEKDTAETAVKTVPPLAEKVSAAETKPAAQVAEAKPLAAPAPTKPEEPSTPAPVLAVATKPVNVPVAEPAKVTTPPNQPETRPSLQPPPITVAKTEPPPVEAPAAPSTPLVEKPEPNRPPATPPDAAPVRPIRADQAPSTEQREPPAASLIQTKPEPARTLAAKVEPSKTNAAKPNLAVVTPESQFNATTLLIAGLALLFVAGLLCWVVLRRVRGAPQPSLISESMDQRPK